MTTESDMTSLDESSSPAAQTLSGWQVGKTIVEVNRYILENQVRCDVTFDLPAGNDVTKTIGAHTLILTSRSPVFEAMFSEGRSPDDGSVKVEDVQYDVFNEFLK